MNNLDIDRIITLGQGVTLVFFSLSGLKCINRKTHINKNGGTSCSGELTMCDTQLKCSMANMNLALSTMGATGFFMTYKSLFK